MIAIMMKAAMSCHSILTGHHTGRAERGVPSPRMPAPTFPAVTARISAGRILDKRGKRQNFPLTRAREKKDVVSGFKKIKSNEKKSMENKDKKGLPGRRHI